MLKYPFIFFYILFLLSGVNAQQKGSIEILSEKFRTFQYRETIELAERILTRDLSLTEPEKLEIYRIKAVSHYSLVEIPEALFAFIEILKIDRNYTLDPTQNSPKIITFFEYVRSGFINIDIKSQSPDTLSFIKTDTVYFNENRINVHNDLSSLVPGMKQLKNRQKTKGWLILAGSITSLAAGIYYSIDCTKKEKEYYNESDVNLISGKYDRYNKSYKLRNISWITFGVFFLYNQWDLTLPVRDNQKIRLSTYTNSVDDFGFRIHFYFN